MAMNEQKQPTIERVRAVKSAHEADLMSRANVVGVGIGYRYRGGKRTEQVALVVMVEQKVDQRTLNEADIIPAEIEGIPVDVQVVGRLRAM